MLGFSIKADNVKAIPHAYEYKCKANRLGDIIDFLIAADNPIRCNIDFINLTMEELINQIEILKKYNIDYTVACHHISNLDDLLRKGYHAYLDYPVTDSEYFAILADSGASDIIIDGPLGFLLDKIKIKYENYNFKIRVCPNQSTNILNITERDNLNSFYIRPEDVQIYLPYIDIIEFKTTDLEAEKVMYNIYSREYFHEDISKLIPHINYSVKNHLLPKDFGEKRLACGQRCLIIPSNKCDYCHMAAKLTNNMERLLKRP